MLLAALRPSVAVECCTHLFPRRLAAVVIELPDQAFDALCLLMDRRLLRLVLEEATVG